ncbi:DUF6461 domain-containing protein [Actinacidiphila guanduensis]|uniref:Uncharacterized protein n=1 Tax=Actinacidiphila guanduensis TaxID=310781 RepID=A0A1H0S2R3_9ACTN|nr:hypothetical protein SAMN05216259_12530 [Actinacidiphila guanduensis]
MSLGLPAGGHGGSAVCFRDGAMPVCAVDPLPGTQKEEGGGERGTVLQTRIVPGWRALHPRIGQGYPHRAPAHRMGSPTSRISGSFLQVARIHVKPCRGNNDACVRAAVGMDVGWYEDCCLTFTQGLTPEELLRRYGVVPSSARLLALPQRRSARQLTPGTSVLSVGLLGDWAFGFEAHGLQSAMPRVLGALSQGTQTLVISLDREGLQVLQHWTDGHPRESFSPGHDPFLQAVDSNPLWDAVEKYRQDQPEEPAVCGGPWRPSRTSSADACPPGSSKGRFSRQWCRGVRPSGVRRMRSTVGALLPHEPQRPHAQPCAPRFTGWAGRRSQRAVPRW